MLTRLTVSAVGGPNKGKICRVFSGAIRVRTPLARLPYVRLLQWGPCLGTSAKTSGLTIWARVALDAAAGLGAYAYNVENTVLGSRGLDDWACEGALTSCPECRHLSVLLFPVVLPNTVHTLFAVDGFGVQISTRQNRCNGMPSRLSTKSSCEPWRNAYS